MPRVTAGRLTLDGSFPARPAHIFPATRQRTSPTVTCELCRRSRRAEGSTTGGFRFSRQRSRLLCHRWRGVSATPKPATRRGPSSTPPHRPEDAHRPDGYCTTATVASSGAATGITGRLSTRASARRPLRKGASNDITLTLFARPAKPSSDSNHREPSEPMMRPLKPFALVERFSHPSSPSLGST